MDFIKKALDGGHESNQDQKPSDHSNADLFSSAKVVAGAAQAQFQNKSSEINKEQVAGAAANLLDAAQKYGKLDEKQGVGQYVEKAEGYLRGYGQSNKGGPAVGEEVKEHVEKAEGVVKQGGHSAGEAVGEYAKMGEDFLKKQSSGGGSQGSHPGGGAGDFMKAAGDFMKRD